MAPQERQTLLAREVDHRAKNVLAVVQSIVRLSRADNPREFARAVEGRVDALAHAHTLLSHAFWTGADLRDVVWEEVAAFEKSGRVALDGPAVRVKPNAVQPLSMVLHELATNATKYGALSTSSGRVAISWRIASCGSGDPSMSRLHLNWVERDGPPLLVPPTRRGFGSSLIEALVRGQLQGDVAKHWDHDGVRCEISLQAAFVVASPLQEGAAEERVDIDLSASATEPATTSMRGQRVLVAEDELLLALDVAAQLRAVGCTVIGPAASLEEALRLVSTGSRLDAAVLDVMLGKVAEARLALGERGLCRNPIGHVLHNRDGVKRDP